MISSKARGAALVSSAVLLAGSLTLLVGCSSTSSSADYDTALRLGTQAYTYGLPLLETNKTFLTMTSVNVSNGHGFGPVNQFNHVRELNGPGSTAVVAPGANALSSIAWLDLSAEPQVMHAPKVVGHDFVLALLDPYTEDLRNLGSAHATPAGDYAICATGSDAKLPAGVQRIDVDYTRIWVIGSTQLKGPDDVAAVNKIQDGYTLTPLSRYGTDDTQPAPADADTTVDTSAVPTGLEFFDTLGQLLKQFPPPVADRGLIEAFATVGIGPGRTPQVGLGAFTSDQAIFAMTTTDATGTALNGSTAYTAHLPAEPPAGEGWTVTVYDAKGALIENPIGRSQFNHSSKLTKNADGSVDLYFQATQPGDAGKAANWLPVASGQGFEVIWRLLAPKPCEINGILGGSAWQPPALHAS